MDKIIFVTVVVLCTVFALLAVCVPSGFAQPPAGDTARSVRIEGSGERRVDLFRVAELGLDLYPTRESAYKAAQDAQLTTFTVVTVSVRAR